MQRVGDAAAERARVQVDPPELWVHPPFEPTIVEGPDGPELHARGAIDDKGNVAFHLLGIRAHLAATGRDTPAVTVKLLVEGEEESGSPHFADLLRERADRLSCDVVVVTDTGMAAPDVPSAVTAMRGLADAEITLRGPDVDLHSGSFGGAVPNPLHAMATTALGTSRAAMPVSLTTTTSQASRSARSRSNAAKCGEPDSSSPSISNLTVTAGVSRPVAARWARIPSRWKATLPLSSMAPRACSSGPSSPSTTVGSNGGCTHSSIGSTGCTSWWP